ncbi:ATP-binding protein (plasmid) [Streptomyces sp. NBC_00853]|uniref:ATP-binding protein n=1 Tax=Streptomyces sp. NBC_00853 TaxID=2903681 RepID=UPI002F910AED|nr:ATP-binding protein [Streptomyces sp. NBC_00853]
MNATARVPTVPAPYAAALDPTAPGIGKPPCVWGLPHRPESAGTARRIAQAVLDAWGTDSDAADQALLVVSELVTNAVEHALPPVVLRLEQRTDTLRIEVEDGGPAPADGAWSPACDPEEHGRGGRIVAQLATACGTRALPRGATHWADLPATDSTRVRAWP